LVASGEIEICQKGKVCCSALGSLLATVAHGNLTIFVPCVSSPCVACRLCTLEAIQDPSGSV
jgi:hypothetical protein